MADVYIEDLKLAESISDTDCIMLHTETEDLKISIGDLKRLLIVSEALKLSSPFSITLSGDAVGSGSTDGTDPVEISVSSVEASRLKNDIKINGTAFTGEEGITTEHWGKERKITIGGCERMIAGESDVIFPATEVFSGSGQPYIPTSGGTMTGDLNRNINDSDYSVFSATTETVEDDVSVKMKIGDINADTVILSLSQPYWNNGVNIKKLLTEDDIFELDRRISELESMATSTLAVAKENESNG